MIALRETELLIPLLLCGIVALVTLAKGNTLTFHICAFPVCVIAEYVCPKEKQILSKFLFKVKDKFWSLITEPSGHIYIYVYPSLTCAKSYEVVFLLRF